MLRREYSKKPTRAEKTMSIPAWRRVGLSITALLALSAIASPAGSQSRAGEDKTEAKHEHVVIINKPTLKSRVHGMLSRFAHKVHSLTVTGAEVWSIPESEASRIIKRLEDLGHKAIELKNDWKHILMRPKEPVSLAPAHQAVVDKVSGMAETVNVNLFKMPHAAVVEHAMKHPEGKVVLPLGDDKTVTLFRTQTTVQNDKGFSWRGETEGSGEAAALMRGLDLTAVIP